MYVISKENKFLVGFVLALIAFTAVTVSSVASNDPTILAEKPESDRAPASIKKISAKPAKMKFQSISVNLCDLNSKQVLPVNVNGQFVQVKGRGCASKSSYSAVKIVNQTNGYTASIMPFGKDQYQTDLIQLIPGTNQILIKYVSPKGTSEERKIELRADMTAPQI